MTISQEHIHNFVTDYFSVAGKLTEQCATLFNKAWDQSAAKEDPSASVLSEFAHAFQEFSEELMKNPMQLPVMQMEYLKKQQEIFQNVVLRMLGQNPSPVLKPEKTDRRFNDEEWSTNPIFDYLKQSYLLQSQTLLGMVEKTTGISEHNKKKVEYFVRQLVNALSPSNFASLNPEVIRKTLETGGSNLIAGFAQLQKDMEESVRGALNIAMTDTSAFQVGRNLATTPGKVVYQNELMQLIQYTSTTSETFKRPLLIIPPFINKYYILDLREHNSLIRWLVAQGHSVFCISWVNPGPAMRDMGFADYMEQGPLAALAAIEQASGEKEINAIGYCLGGTLLAATLAYLKKIKQEPIKSATFMATLTDFSKPGEIGIFINETAISALEKQMNLVGYYDGRQMAFSFNTLRENDLFWSFFINNYLKGERPAAFDLLYWNTDSTNLPARMHSWYLRNMYLENKLIEPDALELNGVKLDLRQITIPAYFISAAQDHIAIWQATYKGATLMGGKNRFVLGGSGHIAGIVNPPAANKYGYWINEQLPADPQAWFQDSTQQDGSWWLDWAKWVAEQGGTEKVPARVAGEGLSVIEDAPGSYVKQSILSVIHK